MNCKEYFTERFFKHLFCKHSSKLIFIRNIHGDEINALNARSMWKCPDCGEYIYKNYEYNPGEISDGYHTFNELYHHKAILFAVICHVYNDRCWKSLKHSDGTMYDGMFIVGIDTNEGPATYHCDMDYWNTFNVKEIPNSPEWDGHTPTDAINRIYSLLEEDSPTYTINKLSRTITDLELYINQINKKDNPTNKFKQKFPSLLDLFKK